MVYWCLKNYVWGIFTDAWTWKTEKQFDLFIYVLPLGGNTSDTCPPARWDVTGKIQVDRAGEMVMFLLFQVSDNRLKVSSC